MKKTIFILITLLVTYSPAIAERISGTGFAPTLAEAKKEALAELSQNIRVEVNSEFKSIVTQRNKSLDELKTRAIHLKSELPILGAEYSQLSSKKELAVEAILKFSTVRLYELELEKTITLIDKNLEALKKTSSNSGKVEILQTILTHIDQYYKYRIVAQLMHSKKIPEITITEAEIKNRLSSLEKKADTIDFGAKVLSRKIKKKREIFIYPPTPVNTSEVTQFGSALKDHLSQYLKTVSAPQQAKYFLTGEYRILNTGIELTCHLLDAKSNTLKTAMIFFLPSAYDGYTVKPVALDFEKLIKSGYIVSGDFRVNIKTEKGKRDLLYKQGEAMRILIKMNKPGYFYLVSHNIKKDKYSYIVNFTEDAGNRKFVYYINGDEVNKWVELGEFEIVPPFGVETLQMLASTNDLINYVPKNFFDDQTGLYKIGKKSASKPEKALTATRGLIMKKKSAKAEAILVFTSMETK